MTCSMRKTCISSHIVLAALAFSVGGCVRLSCAADATVTFTTIASNAYVAGDINSCAIDINNLTTYGGYQFAAYYDKNDNIMIARRATGASTWQTFTSGISIPSSDITDDHNVIAIAVDSTGTMSMSWNMHNVTLNYAVSNASVLAPTLAAINFTQLNAANTPTLFPQSGATTNEVTYPTFYHIPNSDNLLFAYRNGGSGGGSGNGNEYFNIYNPTTKTFSQSFVINGEKTSVNAYLNNLVYDSKGNLLATWTWRATPNWQTNSNIVYAQSPDNGVTWYKQGGATKYALPIIQSGRPSASVAQVVKSIPQNSSFINQTSMTVDQQDHPMIASYWDPTATGDAMASVNGHNRQYMLEYYTGTQWVTSQITQRTSDTSIDTGGGDVRDLGRPIVLVDKQNRILVITRSEDTKMGAAVSAHASDAGNNIVVYYTTDSMAAADGGVLPSTLIWQSITLDDANMGQWEPTYDAALWASDNKLDLFYEPVALSGEVSGNVSVLEWDEQAFFAAASSSVPEPASVGVLMAGAVLLLRRRRRAGTAF